MKKLIIRRYQDGGAMPAETQAAAPAPEAGGGAGAVEQLKAMVGQYMQSQDPGLADQIVMMLAELLGMGSEGAPSPESMAPQGAVPMAQKGAKIYSGDPTGRTRGTLVEKPMNTASTGGGGKSDKKNKKIMKNSGMNSTGTYSNNFKSGGKASPYDRMMAAKKKFANGGEIEVFQKGGKNKKGGQDYSAEGYTKKKDRAPLKERAQAWWDKKMKFPGQDSNIDNTTGVDNQPNELRGGYIGQDYGKSSIVNDNQPSQNMMQPGQNLQSLALEIDPTTGRVVPIGATNIPGTNNYQYENPTDVNELAYVNSNQVASDMDAMANLPVYDTDNDAQKQVTGRNYNSVGEMFKAFKAAGVSEGSVGYVNGKPIAFKFSKGQSNTFNGFPLNYVSQGPDPVESNRQTFVNR